MNARAEDFDPSDERKSSYKYELPNSVELMNEVFAKRQPSRFHMNLSTDTSSACAADMQQYSIAQIPAASLDSQKIGSWLLEYSKEIKRKIGSRVDLPISTGYELQGMFSEAVLRRRKAGNQAAIALLQSWIDEDEGDQQERELALLKEAIDEERLPDRQLFK